MSETLLVIVNYRSAALTAASIASARASTATPLRVVVVDNSCDPAEARALEESGADRLIVAEENLGYGRAINEAVLGSDAPIFVAANPDVEWESGAIDRLLERVRSGAALAGPRISWDREGEWILPPAETLTRQLRMGELLASRSHRRARSRDEARVRERIRFWSLKRTMETGEVSGAVMAIDRAAFERTGGFDPRFRLYFEEIDLMRRLRNGGKRIVYVAEARCRHLYNQSAPERGDAAELFAESERRFLLKWTGGWFTKLSSRYGREIPPPFERPFEDHAADSPFEVGEEPAARVIEISPLRNFNSAAGHFPASGSVRVPGEILQSWRGGDLHVRVVDRRSGKTLRAWKCPPLSSAGGTPTRAGWSR
ncbi:MAG: glycosyltransferase [Thermoanaerobaculia bacterium]